MVRKLTNLSFAFGQLVAKADKKFSIALALIRREGKNASEVVVLIGLFFLAVVSDDFSALNDY